MSRILIAGALALAISPVLAAPTASLTVKIEKVSPRGGNVRVALYNAQNYAGDHDPVADKVAPAHAGETIVTLENLAPGTYAVKMFQDFNKNGEFDTSWLGLPLEKYGFSNDAHPTFSEPSFDATKFELRPGANTITIHLQ